MRASVPVLSWIAAAILLAACGSGIGAPGDDTLPQEPPRPDPDVAPIDAGPLDEDPDAGDPTPIDAGSPDPQGSPDAGAPDAGVTDGGGGIDPGLPDAGSPDAGSPDAGLSTTMAPGNTARVTAPDFLNLRNGPSQSATVIEEMACGESVTILSGPSGRWWEVTHGANQGWASGVYLVPSANFDPSVCPTPPPTPGTGTGTSSTPPASLVNELSTHPYVEANCVSTTFPGWNHPAKACTYGGGLQVTVADPSPDRAARWIVDSAGMIPALDGLRTRDPAHFEEGLIVIARNMMGQSSRIFPLSGRVREGTINYPFDRGVTMGCSTGCYCRINSTTRREWCRYRAQVLRQGSESSCLALYSTTTFTEAWARHCLDNHDVSWDSDTNPHFRARAYNANLSFGSQFPDPARANGAAVVRALQSYFPTY